jgi:hypothetical protein
LHEPPGQLPALQLPMFVIASTLASTLASTFASGSFGPASM